MDQHVEPRARLLRATEVAAELGVRTAFVYALARRRAIPVVRVGRYFRFDPTALARWKEAGGSGLEVPTIAGRPAEGRRLRPRGIR